MDPVIVHDKTTQESEAETRTRPFPEVPSVALFGWGAATGNGGMCSDIARLSNLVNHWVVPNHPTKEYHEPYLEQAFAHVNLVPCSRRDNTTVKNILSQVDGILYVENPCFDPGTVDIVGMAKQMGVAVVGIPMWEWWPMDASWAQRTDAVWAVTEYTRQYLQACSVMQYARGVEVAWKDRIVGGQWGVDLGEFPFVQRATASTFGFVNGNGGYKGRKGLESVLAAFNDMPDVSLLVFSQVPIASGALPDNVRTFQCETDTRSEVYQGADVYLFPSYWEGLCHGLYEAQSSGAIVVTTDDCPMNECGTPWLLSPSRIETEYIDGRDTRKAVVAPDELIRICRHLHQTDIHAQSREARDRMACQFDLRETINELDAFIKAVCSECRRRLG